MSNSKEAVTKMLIPALTSKKIKDKMVGNVQANRESKFIKDELELLSQMLSGEYRFNKMQ